MGFLGNLLTYAPISIIDYGNIITVYGGINVHENNYIGGIINFDKIQNKWLTTSNYEVYGVSIFDMQMKGTSVVLSGDFSRFLSQPLIPTVNFAYCQHGSGTCTGPSGIFSLRNEMKINISIGNPLDGECATSFEIEPKGVSKSWLEVSANRGMVNLLTFDGYEWTSETIFQPSDGHILTEFSRELSAYLIANITNSNTICRSSTTDSSIWTWVSSSSCWSAASNISVTVIPNNQTLCGSPVYQMGDIIIFYSIDSETEETTVYAWNIETGEQNLILRDFFSPVYYVTDQSTLMIFLQNSTVNFYNSQNFQFLSSQYLRNSEISNYFFNESSQILSAFGTEENQTLYKLQFFGYKNQTFSYSDESPPVDLLSLPQINFMCSTEYQTVVLGAFLNIYDTAIWDGKSWNYYYLFSRTCYTFGDSIIIVTTSNGPSPAIYVGSELLYTFPFTCSITLTSTLQSLLYLICDNTLYSFDFETLIPTEISIFQPSFINSTFFLSQKFVVTPDNSSVIFGGEFQFTMDNVSYSNIAKYSFANQKWEYFDPIPGVVVSITRDSEDTLFIGGTFSYSLDGGPVSNVVACKMSTGICYDSLNGGVPWGVEEIVIREESNTLYMLLSPLFSTGFQGWQYEMNGSATPQIWSDSILAFSLSYQTAVPPDPPFYTNMWFSSFLSLMGLTLVLIFVAIVVKLKRKRYKDYIFLPEIENSLWITFPKMCEVLKDDSDIMKIDEKEIDFLEAINAGGQGVIFKAIYKQFLVAAKSITILDPMSLTDFRKEIKILR